MQLAVSVVSIIGSGLVARLLLTRMHILFCRVQSHTLEAQSSVSCTAYLSRVFWFSSIGLTFRSDETPRRSRFLTCRLHERAEASPSPKWSNRSSGPFSMVLWASWDAWQSANLLSAPTRQELICLNSFQSVRESWSRCWSKLTDEP